MAFDPSTAQPVGGDAGFDPSTAKPFKPQGAASYLASQAKAGLTADLPTIAGKALQYAGATDLGGRMRAYGEANAAQAQPDENQGAVTKMVAGAIRGAAPIVPLAAGTLAANVFAPEVAVPLELAGAAGLAGGFGGAQAQDTFEKAKAAGLNDEQATSAARKTGAITGIGMGAVGALTGGIAAPAIRAMASPVAKTAAESLAATAAPSFVRPFAAETAGHLAGNVASMAAANAGTAAVEQQAGLPGPTPGQAALEGVESGASLTAALLPFGAARTALAKRANTAAIARLQSASTDPEQRTQIAAQIHANLKAIDPTAANHFAENVQQSIDLGQPVTLGEHLLKPYESQAAPATPPAEIAVPNFGTSPGAAAPKEGMDFERQVDTSGLGLVDPQEQARAQAASIDFAPADQTPSLTTSPGAAGEPRTGLPMPPPEIDTSGLSLKPSEAMGLDPNAGPISRAAVLAVDSGAHQHVTEQAAQAAALEAAAKAPKGKNAKAAEPAAEGAAPDALAAAAGQAGGSDPAGLGLRVPAEQAVEPNAALNPAPNKIADGLGKMLNKAAKRAAMESEGQGILDDMAENKESPRDVAQKFWRDTYFKLPPDAQERFRRMADAHSGGEDVLTSSGHAGDVFDLPTSAENLEGTERGFVALMKSGNDRFAQPEAAKPNVIAAGRAKAEEANKFPAGKPSVAEENVTTHTAALRENELDAVHSLSDLLPERNALSDVPLRSAMRQIGFTEGEIKNATAAQALRGPSADGEGAGGAVPPAQRAPQAGAGSGNEAPRAAEAAKPAKGLSLGIAPGSAEPVSVKDGIVHIGKDPAIGFDSGEPVTVKAGATDAEIKQALKDAGAVSRRQKFYGGQEASTTQAPVAHEPNAAALSAPTNEKKAEAVHPIGTEAPPAVASTTSPVAEVAPRQVDQATTVAPRPTNWRSNFMQATQVGKSVGIPYEQGRKLSDLLALIDAKDKKGETISPLSKTAESATSGIAADGKSRAVAGGQQGINGYDYKGGQFLPSTMAEPGKWKVKGKWVNAGREEVGPSEWSHQPTPFSRSIYSLIGSHVTMDGGKMTLRPNIRDSSGSPITPQTEVRPGVRGVLGKESLTVGELIDAYNKGQRWFDVQPDAETITTQEPTHKEQGKPAESASAPVVAESLKKAAKAEDRTPAQMKADLLGKIDTAMEKAPKPREDIGTTEPQKSQGKLQFTGVIGEGDERLIVSVREGSDGRWHVADSGLNNLEQARHPIEIFTAQGPAAARKHVEAMMPRLIRKDGKLELAPPDMVTFDVPGDGVFKVLNDRDRMAEFRGKVEKSPGFSDKGTPRTEHSRTNIGDIARGIAPGSAFGVEKGSGPARMAVQNMVEEHDFQAALDYATVKGVSLDDLKLSKPDRAKLDEWLKTNPKPTGDAEATASAPESAQTTAKPNAEPTAPAKAQKASEASDQPLPAISEAQARKQFEWRNLGQKDGVKTHTLFFFEHPEQKGGSESMGQAKIEMFQGSSGWRIDGEGQVYREISDAKRAAEDAAIGKLRDNGYVQKAPEGGKAEPQTARQIAEAIAKARPDEDVATVRADAREAIVRQLGQKALDAMDRGTMMTSDELTQAIHDGQYAATREYAAKMPVPVHESDIPREAANRAHQGTSFNPERRGASEQRDYVRTMVDAWKRAEAATKGDTEALARVTDVMRDLVDGYRSRVLAELGAHSRIVSSMIAGPSKFPVARMQKANAAADKRAQEAREFLDKDINRMLRAARAPIDNSPDSELARVKSNLEEREKRQALMKAVNVALRKGDDSALKAMGLSDEGIAELKKPDFAGRTGFPDYKLTNNNAEIRRLRERLASAQERTQEAAAGPVERTYNGVKIEENATDDRLRLNFDGKPSEEVRTDLKANGFRWSPNAGAWQRQLTDNARQAAKEVLDKHFPAGEAPSFARGESKASGLTPEAFSTALSKAFGEKVADRLQQAGVVVPIADQSQLPDHVVPFVRSGDKVFGFHDPVTNHTYAVLSNLSPEIVKGLTLHEVGVHYGFNAMLGREKYTQVIARLKFMGKAGNAEVRAALRQAKMNAVDPRQVPEETLAYLVTNHPEMGFVREVVASIKAFLFKHFGIGGKYLTADDMTALAKAAVLHASRTEPGARAPDFAQTQPTQMARKGDSIEQQLQSRGQQIESMHDAERRFGKGEQLFALHEMGDAPTPVTSLEVLRNFTPDQLMALPSHTGLSEVDRKLAAGFAGDDKDFLKFSRTIDAATATIDKIKDSEAAKHLDTAWDGVKMATAPQYRSPAAQEIARTIIAGMGEKEMRGIRFRSDLNKAIGDYAKANTLGAKARDLIEKGLTVQADKVFLRNSPEENRAFMQAMDTGDGKYFDAHPELRQLANVIGQMFDEKALEIQTLDTGALQQVRENYFPHIWNREPSGDKQREIFSTLAKRPLEGRKGFTKQRVFEDVQAGIDAGFEPVSNNPLDLVMLKMEEMDKYILAHKTLSAMEGTNGVHLIAAGEKTPQGFVDVNGRFGGIERNGEKLRYVAREDVGQVINNYLSPNLYHNKYVGKPFTAYMGAANTLNQFQLGVFSAFHAGFTSFEAVISHASIGIKALTAGDFKGAAKYLGSAPAAWINNPKMGSKIIEHMMDSAVHPEMAPILQGLQLAGFKWQMDNRFRTDHTKTMLQAWSEGKAVKAGLNAIGAVTEQSARPILEWLVPRQKFGVFGEMYHKWMQDNPNATHEELRNSAQQIWNRVDSRLGQVVYDRLFVHNVAKNFAQMLIRAPGWTGGTILEVGGGMKDLASYAKALALGQKPPSISDRAAYTLSMLMTTAIANAALTAMFTGQAPQDWKDLVAFRSGNLDENGRPERFMLPTYMKDVYAYSKAPGTTLVNKSHPLLSLVGDVTRNRDFFGTEIRSEDDNLFTQLAQTAGFAAKAFVPFWMKGVQKEKEREGSAASMAAPLVGVMPAPSGMDKTAAEALMSKYSVDRLPQGTRTQEETDKANLRRQMYVALRKGEQDKAREVFEQGKEQGLFGARDYLKVVRQARMDPLTSQFSRLSYEQAQRVMKVASDDEKQELAPAFMKKRIAWQRQHAGVAAD